MRTSLFFAVAVATSLLAGGALAEKPTERLRARGDVIDKAYKSSNVVRERQAHASRVQRTQAPKQVVDRGESRWNCGGGDECRAHGPSAVARTYEAKSHKVSDPLRQAKVNEKASQRWSCADGVDTCSAPKSQSRAAATAKTTASKGSAAQKNLTARTTPTSPAADKSKGDKSAPKMSGADRVKADRMIKMLKSMVCKKLNADCGGEER